jgi:hypothetical protein
MTTAKAAGDGVGGGSDRPGQRRVGRQARGGWGWGGRWGLGPRPGEGVRGPAPGPPPPRTEKVHLPRRREVANVLRQLRLGRVEAQGAHGRGDVCGGQERELLKGRSRYRRRAQAAASTERSHRRPVYHRHARTIPNDVPGAWCVHGVERLPKRPQLLRRQRVKLRRGSAAAAGGHFAVARTRRPPRPTPSTTTHRVDQHCTCQLGAARGELAVVFGRGLLCSFGGTPPRALHPRAARLKRPLWAIIPCQASPEACGGRRHPCGSSGCRCPIARPQRPRAACRSRYRRKQMADRPRSGPTRRLSQSTARV